VARRLRSPWLLPPKGLALAREIRLASYSRSSCNDADIADQLLQSQQNDVFQAVQLAGLEPAEFEWETVYVEHEYDVVAVPRLVHAPTRFWFTFDFRDGHIARYSPGRDALESHYGTRSWQNQLGAAGDWLSYLNREYRAADEPRADIADLRERWGDMDSDARREALRLYALERVVVGEAWELVLK
jgi:hypothetical protein